MGIRAITGFPDGNGQGWNLRRVVTLALLTPALGWAGVTATQAGWSQVKGAAAATITVYTLPIIVNGPAGNPELGLVKRVEAIEEIQRKAAPMPPELVNRLDAFLKAQEAKPKSP